MAAEDLAEHRQGGEDTVATQDTGELTGVRREGPAWGVYLGGRRVGECVRFTKAQAKLTDMPEAEKPAQQPAVVPPAQPVNARPQRVTIVATGRRDWPGSRVVRDERLELVQVDDAQPRPAKQGMSLNQALDWLQQAGYEAECKTSSGMTNWISLSGGPGNVEARRKCVFVRRAA